MVVRFRKQRAPSDISRGRRVQMGVRGKDAVRGTDDKQRSGYRADVAVILGGHHSDDRTWAVPRPRSKGVLVLDDCSQVLGDGHALRGSEQ